MFNIEENDGVADNFLNFYLRFLASNFSDALKGKPFDGNEEYFDVDHSYGKIKNFFKDQSPLEKIKLNTPLYANNLSLNDHFDLFVETFGRLQNPVFLNLKNEDKYVLYLLAATSKSFVKDTDTARQSAVFCTTKYLDELGKDYPDELSEEKHYLKIKELSDKYNFKNENLFISEYIFSDKFANLLFDDDIKDVIKILENEILKTKTLDDLINENRSFKDINNFYNIKSNDLNK